LCETLYKVALGNFIQGGPKQLPQNIFLEHTSHGQQNRKEKYKREDGTGEYGEQHQEEKTAVAWPRVAHEQGREFQQVFYGVCCGFDSWSFTFGLH